MDTTERPDLKLLIMDWDGVIVDTETPYWREWMAEFARLEVTVSSHLWADLMMKNHCPSQLLREQFGINLTPQRVKTINGAVWEQIRASGMMEGALELLESAREQGCLTALATNAPSTWLELTKPKELLQRDWFEIVEVDANKPSPDAIKRILKAANVSPSEAAGADDTRWGCHAFVSAGVRVLHVPSEPYKNDHVKGVERRESLAGITLDALSQMAFYETPSLSPTLGLQPLSA